MIIEDLKSKIEQLFPYKRKKPIEDWDFIMVFEEYYKQEVEMVLSALKCQDDLKWCAVDHKDNQQVLFLIHISDRMVEEMAHELKILKKKDKKSFKFSLKDVNTMIYTTDHERSPHVYNYLCFIRARMYPSSKEIYEQEQYSAFNKYKKELYLREPDGTLFTDQEELKAKYHFLLTYSEKLDFKNANQSQGIVEDSARQPLAKLLKHAGFRELVPIQKVSKYRPLMFESQKKCYGANIDCYFQFVGFMQKWLIFPMIIGILTVAINAYFNYTAENSPFDFIYAWAIMIWSILFITRWQEVHKWLKIKDGSSGDSEIWSEHQNIISKRGMEKHISSTTGKAQYYLALRQRIFLHVVSNFASIGVTVITLLFMVLSLNLRGFIHPSHKLFYFESLSKLTEPGGIFDANTARIQIPNIIHVLVTNGFDQRFYRPMAKSLAKFERHLSTKGYENSIIIKYFVYEFIITFADLFYIAFVRLDIVGLREQLFSLFFIDIIRRLVAETIIPWVKKTHRSKQLKQASIKQTGNLSEKEELAIGAISQINKDSYEPFDDYLEIITNIGYLVMISSCFPLAPLLILIAHEVELLQDKYKIVHILKRRLPHNYVGMGRWKNIIVFICYISIVTNIMLFAFSSSQVTSVFPKMFESGKDLLYGNTDLATIVGGAAAGILSTVMNITDASSINLIGIMNGSTAATTLYSAQLVPESPLQVLSEDGAKKRDQCEPFDVSSPLYIEPSNFQQFTPPKKDSEIAFVAILFFIEHFFLLLFIILRDMLKKRKSEGDIFLERKEYKRKIKKNLPKQTLSLLMSSLIISKGLKKKSKNILVQLKQTDEKQRKTYTEGVSNEESSHKFFLEEEKQGTTDLLGGPLQ